MERTPFLPDSSALIRLQVEDPCVSLREKQFFGVYTRAEPLLRPRTKTEFDAGAVASSP